MSLSRLASTLYDVEANSIDCDISFPPQQHRTVISITRSPNTTTKYFPDCLRSRYEHLIASPQGGRLTRERLENNLTRAFSTGNARPIP